MPVRFKDTAEYRQRLSPHTIQKVPKNSKQGSDLPSGTQPLVSILKTSILPTDVHQRAGISHSDEYVLLGNQSKFAPSIRYRLRPTAVHQATLRQGTEDAEARGHSSSQSHSDVEGSLLIGQGINRRRSQSCQSNAGDIKEATRDSKAKKKLIPHEENRLPGGVIVDEDKEKVRRQGHRLGQTYNITRSQLQGGRIRSSSKEHQQQPLESHQHRHRHRNDDGEQLTSKDNHTRLHQATQTNDMSHRQSVSRERSDEERRRRRIEAKDPLWQQNKENMHSHSAEDQPISRQDHSYHRNSNNNSATQKRMLSHQEEKRQEKSEGQQAPSAERHRDKGREVAKQRDPSAERHRDRGREAARQRDPSAERHRDRGREAAKQRDPPAERHRDRDEERGRRETETQSPQDSAKDQQNNHDRTQHSAKETKPKKDTPGIFTTSGSSASTHTHPHHPHRHQQQHLQPKKVSSRDQVPPAENTKNISQSTRKTLVQEGKKDGKTLSEDRFLSEKRNHNQRSLTEAKFRHHDFNSQNRSTSAGEEKRATGQSQVLPSKATATQTTDRLGSKAHRSGSVSKAEHDSHASVKMKDEIIQTDLPTREAQRTKTREDEFRQQPKSPKAVSPLRNHSEYQRQFQWRRPTAEAFVQQQQQPTTRLHPRSAISLSHPDFLTLFASDSADKEEDTEYRFQFRPISARNDCTTDRGNSAVHLNQLRRGQSLRDLVTGERNEEINETATSVIVRHHDNQPRKYRSEYMRNFQPPWNYQYEDGTWKELEKERRNNLQASADDVTEVDSSLVRSSSSASSWYEEVLQLRRHAEEYRRRSHGTHFSREQLEQLYARNIDLRDTVVSSALSQNDSSRRRNTSSSVSDLSVGRKLRRTDEGQRMEDERRRRRRREDGRREERTMDEGASGRPLRHHFDRASHQHRNNLSRGQAVSSSSQQDAFDDSELSSGTEAGAKSLRHVTRETRFQGRESGEERQRRPVDRVTWTSENLRNEDRRETDLSAALSSPDDFRSTDTRLREQSTESMLLSEAMKDNRTKTSATETDLVSREDKSVQINFDGGTAVKSNRPKIISSSSLASEVLERARNRNDKFWSK